MGREVRRVPANWQHPRSDDDRKQYIPLREGEKNLVEHQKEWDENCKQYHLGFVKEKDKWVPRPSDTPYRYCDYYGSRPCQDEYMPYWDKSVATHYQMYENTTEGTPISPVFATPEELARWLVDNKASAFGGMTASYEQWLRVCNGGWAPSAVVIGGVLQSGVVGLAEREGK